MPLQQIISQKVRKYRIFTIFVIDTFELGQNIRKLNEAIKTASSVIFTALDTYNGTPDEKIESTIRESMTGGYYTNTDNLTSLHKQIKSAIESSVFRNVAECVDFVIHRYIPIMKQAKSNNTFKNLNETNFNKHGMEVFAGGNKILNESIESYLRNQ